VVSVSTIARWKKRASVHDASHTPHRLQTTLTPAQESIVLVLRKSLGLSLDDLLANHQLPQKALGHVSPIQAMKQWQRSHPELFNRRVTNQPGHDM
jgi:hypothetical protein